MRMSVERAAALLSYPEGFQQSEASEGKALERPVKSLLAKIEFFSAIKKNYNCIYFLSN